MKDDVTRVNVYVNDKLGKKCLYLLEFINYKLEPIFSEENFEWPRKIFEGVND